MKEREKNKSRCVVKQEWKKEKKKEKRRVEKPARLGENGLIRWVGVREKKKSEEVEIREKRKKERKKTKKGVWRSWLNVEKMDW